MSEAKFTKGCWSYTNEYTAGNTASRDVQIISSVTACGGNSQVLVAAEDFIISSKQNLALIAAAPEMYEVLEALADLDECQMHKAEINELLAKARGD